MGTAGGRRVLGCLANNETTWNLTDSSLDHVTNLTKDDHLVAVVGTAGSGKTTTACALIRALRRDHTVAAVKLSGSASEQDINAYKQAGAELAYDLVDVGMVSSCVKSAGRAVDAALGILEDLERDLVIVAEFSGDLFDEHHVLDLLHSEEIRQNMRAVVVCANDLTGAWGAKELLKQCGVEAVAVSGPIANNEAYARYVESRLDITAESNQSGMPETMRLIELGIRRYGDSCDM